MYIALFSSARVALALARKVVPLAAKRHLLENGEGALLKLDATEEALEYVRALHALHGTVAWTRKALARYREGGLPDLKGMAREWSRRGAYITPLPSPEGDFPPRHISSLIGRGVDQLAARMEQVWNRDIPGVIQGLGDGKEAP